MGWFGLLPILILSTPNVMTLSEFVLADYRQYQVWKAEQAKPRNETKVVKASGFDFSHQKLAKKSIQLKNTSLNRHPVTSKLIHDLSFIIFNLQNTSSTFSTTESQDVDSSDCSRSQKRSPNFPTHICPQVSISWNWLQAGQSQQSTTNQNSSQYMHRVLIQVFCRLKSTI